MGGRDPREFRRGGEPDSKGEGEGGGAEETLLQHGVSSPRGGCKHGTRAPFQGSPLKGQRLRRDLDSAAAFTTSGAGAACLAGRRAQPRSLRAPGGAASLPASRPPGRAFEAAWQALDPAHGSRLRSLGGRGPPARRERPHQGGCADPLLRFPRDLDTSSFLVFLFGNGNNDVCSAKWVGLVSDGRRGHLAVSNGREKALCYSPNGCALDPTVTVTTHCSLGPR